LSGLSAHTLLQMLTPLSSLAHHTFQHMPFGNIEESIGISFGHRHWFRLLHFRGILVSLPNRAQFCSMVVRVSQGPRTSGRSQRKVISADRQ